MDADNLTAKRKYALSVLDSDRDKAERIITEQDYDPIFKPVEINGESEISSTVLNCDFDDILMDMNILDSEINITAQSIDKLLQYTKLQLDNAAEQYENEKERLEDIVLLCSQYSGFSNAIQINNANSEGTLDYYNNSFTLPQTNFETVSYKITDIIGNGYEGNDFVYDVKNLKFQKDTSDTSDRKYINDASKLTYYEYSRLVSSNKDDKELNKKINIDSQMAKCIISIEADKEVNYMELVSDDNDIVVNKVEISNNNIDFKEIELHDIAVNNRDLRITKNDYSYGSGVIEFKNSKYIKVTMSAGSLNGDTIAVAAKDEDDSTKILEDADRSAIKINSLIIGRKQYSLSGKQTFKKLNTDNIKSLAIYANQYAPDELNIEKCIKYTVTVNGDSYELVPINSEQPGKKIIRISQKGSNAEHVQYINETIKNISVSVDFKSTRAYLSPFVSDLKILIGGE